MSHKIFLSRRNLLALLGKLDAVKEGRVSACTIIKLDNQHPVYPQTMASCVVTAVEDKDYYTDRAPGEMVHPSNLPIRGEQP
jgi:hypothetical protein